MTADVAPVAPRLRSRPVLEVIDSHTCGQPTRVICDGTGLLAGADVLAARDELAAERDWVRRVAVLEPRGHRSMFAAALIAPASPDDDWGAVFMDGNGYPDMCGHATIGLATTLLEAGLVPLPMPDFSGTHAFAIRTPAGHVALRATLDRGHCEAVAFVAPLAYFLGRISIVLDDGTICPVDLAYGGQWYAFLPAEGLGLSVVPDMIDALIDAASDIRRRIAGVLRLTDPRTGDIPTINNIVWTAPPHHPPAAARNVPIAPGGSFDRSPCGTATCARMATLVAQGELEIGRLFVNEGIMGTLYTGIALDRITIGGMSGIVPEVEGSAWITAHARIHVDDRDPLKHGYIVGGRMACL